MVEQSLKIVFLTSDYLGEIGGISQHVEQLTRNLTDCCSCVVINLSRNHDQAEKYIDDVGRTIYVLPRHKSRFARICNFPHKKLLHILTEEKPNLIHIHTLFEAIIAHVNTWPVPTIYTNHCSTYLRLYNFAWGRKLLERTLRKFNAVICPSTELRDKSHHPAVHMIPNGVDLQRFSLERRKQRDRELLFTKFTGESLSGRRVIALTRRLVNKNGVLEFLQRNLETLRELSHSLVILIAGDGPQTSSISSLVEEHALVNVHLLGAISHDRIDDVYFVADICVLPSDIEAISISALEAMAAGAVVFCSPVGGLLELISPGLNGVFLMNKRLEKETLFMTDEALETMRQAAEQSVRKAYDWCKIAEQTCAVFRETLERRGRST